ncbi:DUF805 domain-containing protein [Sulfurovum sp.]|uniref:DUF805 domain-containing protein n=1 Tax=Sulfurovum sp. TaxID=1969726 RepID=UPI0025F0C32F|nr:DUF805 domain-containing protein [Sulfurovum sp.]
MWNVYFGEWSKGRLKRLPYLGYYVLLIVLVIAAAFGMIFAAGSLEAVMNGTILENQAALLEHFGIATLIGVVTFMVVVIVAQVNILAKRIRDMGLPAFWTIVGLIAVSVLLNILFPVQHTEISSAVLHTAAGTSTAFQAHSSTGSKVVQLFDLVVFLCLVFIPSDAFRKRTA